MKLAVWFLALALLAAGVVQEAGAAELDLPQRPSVKRTRHAYAPRIPPYVCNDYGRCWSSSLLRPEDYATGRLTLVNRIDRRAGYCMGYRFQYPVAWGECLGEWDYGRGRIYH